MNLYNTLRPFVAVRIRSVGATRRARGPGTGVDGDVLRSQVLTKFADEILAEPDLPALTELKVAGRPLATIAEGYGTAPTLLEDIG